MIQNYSVLAFCNYISNTAHCNKWALNDFDSWRSQVGVEESFPDNLLSTGDLKLLCSCLCKYVSTVILLVVTNGRLIITSHGGLKSFPDNVLLTDDPKLLCFCLCVLWKWGKRMDSLIPWYACRNRLQVCYQITLPKPKKLGCKLPDPKYESYIAYVSWLILTIVPKPWKFVCTIDNTKYESYMGGILPFCPLSSP